MDEIEIKKEISMPEVSRFFGIIIRMFYTDWELARQDQLIHKIAPLD